MALFHSDFHFLPLTRLPERRHAVIATPLRTPAPPAAQAATLRRSSPSPQQRRTRNQVVTGYLFTSAEMTLCHDDIFDMKRDGQHAIRERHVAATR